MIAFLKRRWILLSCAVVLLGLGMLDFHVSFYEGTRCSLFGVFNGALKYELVEDHRKLVVPSPFGMSLHGMMLGSLPYYRKTSLVSGGGPTMQVTHYKLPLWIPLAAVLGWIVIRELRWREKRAREAATPPGS